MIENPKYNITHYDNWHIHNQFITESIYANSLRSGNVLFSLFDMLTDVVE